MKIRITAEVIRTARANRLNPAEVALRKSLSELFPDGHNVGTVVVTKNEVVVGGSVYETPRSLASLVRRYEQGLPLSPLTVLVPSPNAKAEARP